MKNIPNRIYLNFGFDKEEVDSTADFHDMTDVSWSTEKMNTADLEYMLSERSETNVNTNKMKENLYNALMAYIKAFEKKHEITYNGSNGDDLMDILSFNDYFVHITDIITDIDKDVDKEVFFQWYEDTLDFAMEHGLDRTINYHSYIMGLRFHMLLKKQKT